jgi:hypothetical protein
MFWMFDECKSLGDFWQLDCSSDQLGGGSGQDPLLAGEDSLQLKEGFRVSNGSSYLVHILTSGLNRGVFGRVNLGVRQVCDGSVIEVLSLETFIGDRVGDVIEGVSFNCLGGCQKLLEALI